MSARGALFGYDVVSDLPLERLREGAGTRGTVEVRASPDPLGVDGEPFAELRTDAGEIFFTLTSDGDDLVIWCSLSGTYRLEPARRRVLTEASAPTEEWEDRVVNAIVPIMLAMRGELLLHAAAIVESGRAILVCGPSGRGKSTLAHALETAGCGLLAEDGVALSVEDDRMLAWPGPLGIRLHPVPGDAPPTEPGRRRKRLHVAAADPLGPEPVPVGAVLVLAERGGDELAVRELEPEVALPPVFVNAIAGTPALRQATFSRVAALVRRHPVYDVRLPDDLDRLPAAAAELRARMTG